MWLRAPAAQMAPPSMFVRDSGIPKRGQARTKDTVPSEGGSGVTQ
ncbi:hypothetical protein Pflav_052520 [Phytohabitans flavus]|uniref:Uncharacterized protein n=1 Tax=Phytohabitans flavus TaxID=1076124 RepID=A0A6F8XYA3_9ACTN|nr:hypothetical protein Pflav_052520 [Phytohabitans flavus]